MKQLGRLLKTKLWWIRLRRLFASLSEPIFPLLTIFAGVVTILFDRSHDISNPSLLYGIIAAAAVVWLAQSFFAYRRRTHDPTWALKFQDEWESEDGYKRRKRAGKVMQDLKGDSLTDIEHNEETLSNIDDPLDILEDVGFYMFGDQISPEAAHHHFYYWIAGYWQCAREYIDAVRKDDPTRWENIGLLYETTSAIERELTGKTEQQLVLDNDEREKFIKEEARAGEML